MFSTCWNNHNLKLPLPPKMSAAQIVGSTMIFRLDSKNLFSSQVPRIVSSQQEAVPIQMSAMSSLTLFASKVKVLVCVIDTGNIRPP